MKLTAENLMLDIPDLNRFNVGDEVICDGTDQFDRVEGVIVGIELCHVYSRNTLEPCITLLHDGCLTDGFKPIDLRPTGRAALRQKGET